MARLRRRTWKRPMTTPYNPVVVNTGSKLVVIDTGTGEAALRAQQGRRPANSTPISAASGIDRNAIDVVIISHFHGDHINGLLTPDNKPAFPNAEIMVPAAEWKYFMDDGEMSRAHQGPHGDGVQECAPRIRCAGPQGDAIRCRQGSRARHHLGTHARPHAGPHVVHHRLRQRQGVRARRRHPVPWCSSAIPAGMASTTRTARWRKRRAARSTTCSPPRR